jgi:D-lactate dehydrogenase
MINKETISRMKDGVVIINCSRGELADMESLIDGIESGKIGALGLDVVEGEEGIAHVDHRIDILSNRNMAYLRQFRNVVMTQHMAFYTEEAVESMVHCGLGGIVTMHETGTCPTEIMLH